MVITDPPYNISVKNNFATMGRTGIDFGDWDKGFDLLTWIDIASRKLTKNGGMVIFMENAKKLIERYEKAISILTEVQNES